MTGLAMTTRHITLVAKAEAGNITVHADIPVDDEADTYVVSIGVTPQTQTLDQLYGALSDVPLPEITEDPLPEQRVEV